MLHQCLQLHPVPFLVFLCVAAGAVFMHRFFYSQRVHLGRVSGDALRDLQPAMYHSQDQDEGNWIHFQVRTYFICRQKSASVMFPNDISLHY